MWLYVHAGVCVCVCMSVYVVREYVYEIFQCKVWGVSCMEWLDVATESHWTPEFSIQRIVYK